jgi:hypothetical protein
MASLEERLKRIRQSAAPNIITRSNDTTASTTGSSARINKDEVEDLLQQTSNLVDLERKHSGSHSTDPNIEAWLNDDDYDVDVDDDDGEEEEVAEGGTERTSDGTEMPNTIGQDTVQEIQEESDNLTLRAEEALRDLHSKGVFKEANALLQVEPKTKPVLSRSSSDQNQFNDVPTSISLEDDLADAMGDELGTQKVENQSNEEETTSKEVDDLMKRLALLRSGAGVLVRVPRGKTKYVSKKRSEKRIATFSLIFQAHQARCPLLLRKTVQMMLIGRESMEWKAEICRLTKRWYVSMQQSWEPLPKRRKRRPTGKSKKEMKWMIGAVSVTRMPFFPA